MCNIFDIGLQMWESNLKPNCGLSAKCPPIREETLVQWPTRGQSSQNGMGLKVCQTRDWSEASCAGLSLSPQLCWQHTLLLSLPASLVQFSAIRHRRNMLSTLILVIVMVTQGARGQEQPLGVEDGPVICEEDRDCLSPGDMCCFDLSNLTLASASQVWESAMRSGDLLITYSLLSRPLKNVAQTTEKGFR